MERPNIQNERSDWASLLGHAISRNELAMGYAQKLDAYATGLEKRVAELEKELADIKGSPKMDRRKDDTVNVAASDVIEDIRAEILAEAEGN